LACKIPGFPMRILGMKAIQDSPVEAYESLVPTTFFTSTDQNG
jgi:hypothetical protein